MGEIQRDREIDHDITMQHRNFYYINELHIYYIYIHRIYKY